tara:strand:+ start:2383 stop:2835 length:453 start_codon:yes stop_codon:yes gene_type:complete
LRPTYESEEDRKNEKEIIQYILSVNRDGLSYRKLPINYHMDYAVTEGEGSFPKVIAFVEIKDKRSFKPNYKHIMCDVYKWEEMLMTSNATCLPCWYAVRAGGGIGMIAVVPMITRFEVRYGGRTDRDDPADQHPCLKIPVEKFKKPIDIF